MGWLLDGVSVRLNTALVVPALPSTTIASPMVRVGTETVALLVAKLLASARSGWRADTRAVLVMAPGNVGLKVRFAVAAAPLLTVPRLQTTTVPRFVQVPCDDVERWSSATS